MDEKSTSPWIAATACCALVLIAGGVGVAALRMHLLTRIDTEAAKSKATITQLQNRISTLETQLAAVAQAARPDPAPLEALKTNLGTTDTRLGELASRIEALEKKPEPAPAPPVLPVAAPPPPATDSYPTLKAAVLSGAPYQNELLAWQHDHAAMPAASTPLETFAATGIPSDSMLRAQLRTLIDGLPTETPASESGFIQKLNTRLHGLVAIKKQSAATPYETLRSHSETPDFATIERDISQLPATKRDSFIKWLGILHERDAALAALQVISTPLTPPTAATGM